MYSFRTPQSLAATAAIVAATGLTGPASAADTPEPAQRQAISQAQFENVLLRRTNLRRAAVGCRPFQAHASLVRAARLHSVRMANRTQLSHRLRGEQTLAGRISGAGYRGWRILAENIARTTTRSPDQVFDAWLRSPGHRRNIQNCELREIGIGVRYGAGQVWATQDFGRR